jgi:hypothetical protein
MKLHTQSINIAKSFQTQTLHTDTVRSYSPLDCHYRNLSAGAVIKDSVELCTCACATEWFQTLSKAPFTLVQTCLQIRMAYQCEHTECATKTHYVQIRPHQNLWYSRRKWNVSQGICIRCQTSLMQKDLCDTKQTRNNMPCRSHTRTNETCVLVITLAGQCCSDSWAWLFTCYHIPVEFPVDARFLIK